MDHNVALPSKPRVVHENEFSGMFEIDGLFPGYGHTLGNSLRRIILSSLTGTAITSVKIDGVSHEFSTLPGVQEDVISILLNLKRVRFVSGSEEPVVLVLEVKGESEVTAANIKNNGQVEILNPEQHIATLTEKRSALSMEITVERGLGFVPRESHGEESKAGIGIIPLDATFTPIRRVNYEVENMRVGDRTDFNRLRIFIETDGTMTPRAALERSIEIMIHQLRAIVGFKEVHEEEHMHDAEDAPEASVTQPVVRKSKEQVDTEILKTRIESLKLSTRTIAALDSANIRTIGGLVRKKEEDILAIEGLGIKGLQEIKRALSDFGVTLR